MAKSLAMAKEAADEAKKAAEKRAADVLAAQSEAKALLELLRQTKEKEALGAAI